MKWNRLCLSSLFLAALLGPVAGAEDLVLTFQSRFQAYFHPQHFVEVTVVNDHYGVICDNQDLTLVDLNTLNPEGNSAYISRLAGLDVYNAEYDGNGYLFANLRLGGFAVVYLNPVSLKMELKKKIEEPGIFFERMDLVGDRLYVTAHSSGMRIYDVSNRVNPVLISSLTTGLVDAFSIAVDDNIAYVADGAGGLKVVDISNEFQPFIVRGESLETAEATSEDVLVHNGDVYVAAGAAGVAWYPDGDIERRTHFNTPTCAKEVTLVGERMAVADITGVEVFTINADGSLVRAGGESALYNMLPGGEFTISYRNWQGVTGWGDNRVISSDWDWINVYELEPRETGTQPDITASSQRLFFDVNGQTKTITMTNTGATQLDISEIFNISPLYSVTPDSVSLQPGQSQVFTVEYFGGTPGVSVLTFISNDPDEDELPVILLGETNDPDIGEVAPDFVLDSWKLNHETGEFEVSTFDLSEKAGKIVFLHIFVTWCPSCLPAIADIQNTVIKEFLDDPRVEVAIMSEGETESVLEEYWTNVYLRGQMLFDPTGSVSYKLYSQEMTSTPAGRAYVIDVDRKIVLPIYGYKPDLTIDTIYSLLESECIGDVNGDSVVDPLDAGFVLARLGCATGTGDADCDISDTNTDGVVDPLDVGFVLSRLGTCGG